MLLILGIRCGIRAPLPHKTWYLLVYLERIIFSLFFFRCMDGYHGFVREWRTDTTTSTDNYLRLVYRAFLLHLGPSRNSLAHGANRIPCLPIQARTRSSTSTLNGVGERVSTRTYNNMSIRLPLPLSPLQC